MSLEQQIEEAWKEIEPSFYHDVEYSASSMLETSREYFEAGYRAALASLYVEVKPEDVLACTDYITFENGKWWNRWWYSDEWARERASECDKVFVLEVPSPSEIFGEEGA